MKRIIDRPWLLIVLAFVLLIGAWTTVTIVAHHHALEPLPLPTTPREK